MEFNTGSSTTFSANNNNSSDVDAKFNNNSCNVENKRPSTTIHAGRTKQKEKMQIFPLVLLVI